jgi:hypothetical protein
MRYELLQSRNLVLNRVNDIMLMIWIGEDPARLTLKALQVDVIAVRFMCESEWNTDPFHIK